MCRDRRGGPRTPSRTTDANLDCVFVKNTSLLRSVISSKKLKNRIELVATLDNFQERRDLRKDHQTEKTKLRRKWKRVKDRVREMRAELLDKPPGPERNDLIKKISDTESSLKRLTEVGSLLL